MPVGALGCYIMVDVDHKHLWDQMFTQNTEHVAPVKTPVLATSTITHMAVTKDVSNASFQCIVIPTEVCRFSYGHSLSLSLHPSMKRSFEYIFPGKYLIHGKN